MRMGPGRSTGRCILSSPTGFGHGYGQLLVTLLEPWQSSFIRFSFFVPFVAIVALLSKGLLFHPSFSSPSMNSRICAGLQLSENSIRRSHTSPLPKRNTIASAV